MRQRDTLYFSPKYQFFAIDFNDPKKLIDMFSDRVYGFYINPARLLCKNGDGFASGLLCIVTIDFLSRIANPESEEVGKRIERWLRSNINEFNTADCARRFYKDFRCGLVHEGRIKPFGEFSFESKQMITLQDEIMRVNPGMLLEQIAQSFQAYLSRLIVDEKEFLKLQTCLKNDFNSEVIKNSRQEL